MIGQPGPSLMARLFSGLFCADERVKDPKPKTVMGDVPPKQPVSGSSTLSSTGTDTTRRSLLLGGAAGTRTSATSSESSTLSDNTDHTNTSPRRSPSSLSEQSDDSTSSTFSQLSKDADQINARSRSKVSTAGKALEKRTTDALAVLTKISEEARTTADFIPVVEGLKTLANHYATHSSDTVPIQLLENLGNIPNPLTYNGTLRNLFLATLKDVLLEAKHVDPSKNIRGKFYDITGLIKGFSKIDATDDCRNFLADVSHAKEIGIPITVDNRAVIRNHRLACIDLESQLAKSENPNKVLEAVVKSFIYKSGNTIVNLSNLPKSTAKALQKYNLTDTYNNQCQNRAHALTYDLPDFLLSTTVNGHREALEVIEGLLQKPATDAPMQKLWDAVMRLNDASTIITRHNKRIIIPFPEHITIALSERGLSRETAVEFDTVFNSVAFDLTIRASMLKTSTEQTSSLRNQTLSLGALLLKYSDPDRSGLLPPLPFRILAQVKEQGLNAIPLLQSLLEKHPTEISAEDRIRHILDIPQKETLMTILASTMTVTGITPLSEELATAIHLHPASLKAVKEFCNTRFTDTSQALTCFNTLLWIQPTIRFRQSIQPTSVWNSI